MSEIRGTIRRLGGSLIVELPADAATDPRLVDGTSVRIVTDNAAGNQRTEERASSFDKLPSPTDLADAVERGAAMIGGLLRGMNGRR